MNLLPMVLSTALAILGAAIGVIVAVRAGRSGSDAATGDAGDGEQGLLRLAAVVHTGWEQTAIALSRELRLPSKRDDPGYGQLYLEPQDDHRLLVRGRSEIGRGFVGAVDVAAGRGATAVTYAILRLPDDEDLHERVLAFELGLIAALRRVDPHVDVQLAASNLRRLVRAQSSAPLTGPRSDASPGEQRSA